ncbi:anti-sigma factor [Sphingomonas sp. RP10(2022)]|uniref:Anti-sigma factor n=1 Tax=Sphingomonas liriopis TaxID=2949094 RepID=A0A9X2HT09_9SPHN|nr:anti-sigma factor [Sphingomonas liriopis]MCP3736037.1 anti-sigma factor [Sphingomonas liriopis]
MATPDPDPDMTAAELALGVLDGDERAAALRRLVAEPGFAAEVEWWRDRLAALFADWPAVAAPAHLAARIEATLDRGAAGGAGGAANDNDHRWRTLAILASIAACVLLAVTTLLMLRPAPLPVRVPVTVTTPPPLIAAIAPTTKGAPIAAAYDRASGVVRIAGGVDVPAGRSAEVWAIRGTAAPRSLGLLPARGTARLAVPAALRGAMAAETVLAISIEPAGGSPTGLPTGPVVAAGKLSG